VAPGTAYDAKGLLKSAIRDNNPVIFMEAELMYGWDGEVPQEEYTIELGQADVKREGDAVTIIAYHKPLRTALAAAEQLAKEDIKAEVIDLRSLRPLDEQAIINRSRKPTGWLLLMNLGRWLALPHMLAG
jgi:pyruvate dehydrogenase E1 component beta subunit